MAINIVFQADPFVQAFNAYLEGRGNANRQREAIQRQAAYQDRQQLLAPIGAAIGGTLANAGRAYGAYQVAKDIPGLDPTTAAAMAYGLIPQSVLNSQLAGNRQEQGYQNAVDLHTLTATGSTPEQIRQGAEANNLSVPEYTAQLQANQARTLGRAKIASAYNESAARAAGSRAGRGVDAGGYAPPPYTGGGGYTPRPPPPQPAQPPALSENPAIAALQASRAKIYTNPDFSIAPGVLTFEGQRAVQDIDRRIQVAGGMPTRQPKQPPTIAQRVKSGQIAYFDDKRGLAIYQDPTHPGGVRITKYDPPPASREQAGAVVGPAVHQDGETWTDPNTANTYVMHKGRPEVLHKSYSLAEFSKVWSAEADRLVEDEGQPPASEAVRKNVDAVIEAYEDSKRNMAARSISLEQALSAPAAGPGGPAPDTGGPIPSADAIQQAVAARNQLIARWGPPSEDWPPEVLQQFGQIQQVLAAAQGPAGAGGGPPPAGPGAGPPPAGLPAPAGPAPGAPPGPPAPGPPAPEAGPPTPQQQVAQAMQTFNAIQRQFGQDPNRYPPQVRQAFMASVQILTAAAQAGMGPSTAPPGGAPTGGPGTPPGPAAASPAGSPPSGGRPVAVAGTPGRPPPATQPALAPVRGGPGPKVRRGGGKNGHAADRQLRLAETTIDEAHQIYGRDENQWPPAIRQQVHVARSVVARATIERLIAKRKRGKRITQQDRIDWQHAKQYLTTRPPVQQEAEMLYAGQ